MRGLALAWPNLTEALTHQAAEGIDIRAAVDGTSVIDVPRHRKCAPGSRAPGRIRTCGLSMRRSPQRRQLGESWPVT